MPDEQNKPILAYASRREVPEGEGREAHDLVKGNLLLRMSLFFAVAVAGAVVFALAFLLLYAVAL